MVEKVGRGYKAELGIIEPSRHIGKRHDPPIAVKIFMRKIVAVLLRHLFQPFRHCRIASEI